MTGQERLRAAAGALLQERPDHEPSTREVCEAAGVNAPTLYHYFGTKAGLMDAVVQDAFEAYLLRKRGARRSGDLVIDFAAGWDLHVAFGVENPVLYALMHDRAEGRATPSPAALEAERLLREGLLRLDEAGLLQIGVDVALAMTTATAIGCVQQLVRSGQPADAELAHSMRDGLMAALFGRAPRPDDVAASARYLASRLGRIPELFTAAEEALLRQWLLALADHEQRLPDRSAPGAAHAAEGDQQ